MALSSTDPVGGIYVLVDKHGVVRQVGKTDDFERREREHIAERNKDVHRNPEKADLRLRLQPIHETDDLNEQRGLEQYYHDLYTLSPDARGIDQDHNKARLLKSDANLTYNKQRPVQLNHPLAGEYRTFALRAEPPGRVDNSRELARPGSRPADPVGGIYVLVDKHGVVRQVGKTDDFERREREHIAERTKDVHRNPEKADLRLRLQPIHETDDLNEQRGLEQYYHDLYTLSPDARGIDQDHNKARLLKSDANLTYNKQRPVQLNHPLAGEYRTLALQAEPPGNLPAEFHRVEQTSNSRAKHSSEQVQPRRSWNIDRPVERSRSAPRTTSNPPGRAESRRSWNQNSAQPRVQDDLQPDANRPQHDNTTEPVPAAPKSASIQDSVEPQTKPVASAGSVSRPAGPQDAHAAANLSKATPPSQARLDDDNQADLSNRPKTPSRSWDAPAEVKAGQEIPPPPPPSSPRK